MLSWGRFLAMSAPRSSWLRVWALAALLAGCTRAGFVPPSPAGDRGARGELPSLDRAPAGERALDGARLRDRSPDRAAARAAVIVPLYSEPGNAWTALAAAKSLHPAVPVVAVVNVDSGPGSSSLPGFVIGIAGLAAVGVTVIGYVDTNYALRAATEVKLEIERWSSWYKPHGLSGLFLDRQATKLGAESYYAALKAHATGLGLTLVIGDPGTDPPPSYVGSLDAMIIYQGAGLPSLASLAGWHLNHDRRNFGILCYGVPALDPGFVADAAKRVGYLYLTDDGLPDPWNKLSSYLGPLLAALEP